MCYQLTIQYNDDIHKYCYVKCWFLVVHKYYDDTVILCNFVVKHDLEFSVL